MMISHLESGLIPYLSTLDENIKVELKSIERFVNEIDTFNSREKVSLNISTYLRAL